MIVAGFNESLFDKNFITISRALSFLPNDLSLAQAIVNTFLINTRTCAPRRLSLIVFNRQRFQWLSAFSHPCNFFDTTKKTTSTVTDSTQFFMLSKCALRRRRQKTSSREKKQKSDFFSITSSYEQDGNKIAQWCPKKKVTAKGKRPQNNEDSSKES